MRWLRVADGGGLMHRPKRCCRTASGGVSRTALAGMSACRSGSAIWSGGGSAGFVPGLSGGPCLVAPLRARVMRNMSARHAKLCASCKMLAVVFMPVVNFLASRSCACSNGAVHVCMKRILGQSLGRAFSIGAEIPDRVRVPTYFKITLKLAICDCDAGSLQQLQHCCLWRLW